MTIRLQKKEWAELGVQENKFVNYNKEEWKVCDGYSNYAVSNYGRVKNLPYTYTYPNGKHKHYKEKIKKTCETGKRSNGMQGYLCTRLFDDDGNSRAELVHRLVAKAFIPNPNNYPTVNHINGNKHDNRVDNLEWSSYSNNNQHAYASGLKTDNAILLYVDKNRNIIDICFSKEYAALKNGISTGSISSSIENNTSDCLGNKWIKFVPNKLSITVDDEANGVRNGGFGSTNK